MGLLDEAIREHLDLKRRRGGDPAEIERAERDALGPVRRGPEGSDEAVSNDAAVPDDDLAYEEEAAYEHGFDEPQGLAEPPQFDAPPTAEPAPATPPEAEYSLDQATEVWDEFEPDAPGLVETPRGTHAPQPADSLPPEDEPPRPADPLEEAPIAQAPPEPYAAPPPPPPAEPRAPEPPPVDPDATQQYAAEPTTPDPHPTRPHGDPLGSDTAEYDMELEQIEGEDVLEETPEFLQDTPDHDRLWFEQRPPKDFDFDD
jgi:formin 2